MGLKHNTIFKNENLTLTHNDKEGFWLYDKSRGMNITMKAKTEQEAFIKALTYYEKRLTEVETELESITNKVSNFINEFSNDDNE